MFCFKYFKTEVNEKVNSMVDISWDLQNTAREVINNNIWGKKKKSNCGKRQNNTLTY